MKKIKVHRRAILMFVGMFCSVIATSALVSYWTGSARAGGIPTTNPLYYSGMLTDKSGKVLTGSKSIGIVLWDAATGGNKKCATAATTTTLVQGRFRAALDKTCVKAVQETSDLWVEVIVDSTSMGRTKIGAVPYAVEAQRVAAQDCPAGYVRDTSATGIVLCKRGKDEMVKVGDFWVDRYEIEITNATYFNAGKCNGKGTDYADSKDDYPSTFPDSGNWSTRLYACSKQGRVPSCFMTWFQAQQACLASGKHLCTNGEWQAAATGTPDALSACNVSGTSVWNTGNNSLCSSKFGAMDMVGNNWEWVDWWAQAGKNWMTSDGQKTVPWPSTYGDGKDVVINVNGRVLLGSWVDGLPATARRGGDMYSGVGAGVFAIDLDGPPAGYGTTTGARCCRR